MVAQSVTPCSNVNDTLCEDGDDDQYPENAITTLLHRQGQIFSIAFKNLLHWRPSINNVSSKQKGRGIAKIEL